MDKRIFVKGHYKNRGGKRKWTKGHFRNQTNMIKPNLKLPKTIKDEGNNVYRLVSDTKGDIPIEEIEWRVNDLSKRGYMVRIKHLNKYTVVLYAR